MYMYIEHDTISVINKLVVIQTACLYIYNCFFLLVYGLFLKTNVSSLKHGADHTNYTYNGIVLMKYS